MYTADKYVHLAGGNTLPKSCSYVHTSTTPLALVRAVVIIISIEQYVNVKKNHFRGNASGINYNIII